MDEKLFWEMLSDGRLASLAKNNPLEFDRLRVEALEVIQNNHSLAIDSFQQFKNELAEKDKEYLLIKNSPNVIILTQRRK